MALQGIRRISPGIVQDPSINSGRPIIEGTRVFVDRIIGHLESGMSIADICYEYDLTPEQVQAVKHLSPEQVQYVKGYADALENDDHHLRHRLSESNRLPSTACGHPCPPLFPKGHLS